MKIAIDDVFFFINLIVSNSMSVLGITDATSRCYSFALYSKQYFQKLDFFMKIISKSSNGY